MLRIVIISDDRPGHEKQSLGIAAALRRRTVVTVTTVVVATSPYGQLKALCYWLLPVLLPRSRSEKADLILCCGGKTHFAALARKLAYRTRCCCIMTPGRGFRRFFDLCFVPAHDEVSPAENIVITQGAPNLSINKRNHHKGNGLIVIGGINEQNIWCDKTLLAQVEEVVRYQGWDWVISSSPRTPKAAEEGLRLLADKYANVKFISFKNTGRGWLEKQYDRAAVVWVTSDSLSMLYEALTAGCRLYFFPTKWKNENSKFAKNEQMFLKEGLAVDFASWQLGKRSKSREFNEAQRCADMLLEKWWKEKLQ